MKHIERRTWQSPDPHDFEGALIDRTRETFVHHFKNHADTTTVEGVFA